MNSSTFDTLNDRLDHLERSQISLYRQCRLWKQMDHSGKVVFQAPGQ